MGQDINPYKTIRVEDLCLGMYVVDVGRSWLRHPWMSKSKVITSKRDIANLREYGIKEVVINLSKGVNPPNISEEQQQDRPQAAPAEAPLESVEKRREARPNPESDNVPLTEELPRVRQTYEHSAGAVHYFVDSVSSGRQMDIKLVRRVVNEVLDSVFRNQDAFLALLKVKVYEKYDFAHPLLVTVLSVSFGRYLGMSWEQLEGLGMGAMLQDIGKTRIPREIIEKPERLTPEEFKIAKSHTGHSLDLLREHDHIPREALSMAYYHHERYDGSGYPKGISSGQLHPYHIIAGISDVFDALTADRVYQTGCLPHEALGLLFRMGGRRFPKNWVERFVHCLGIYPTGSVVELSTGELAVVTAVNHGQLLRPRVRLVTDSQGRPLARLRSIDLAHQGHFQRTIKRALDPRAYNIDPARYVMSSDGSD